MAGRLGRGLRNTRALVRQRLSFLARAIEDDQLMPSAQQVLRHRCAHLAESYKTDSHVYSLDTGRTAKFRKPAARTENRHRSNSPGGLPQLLLFLLAHFLFSLHRKL
jgi:hypothetical protein